MRKTKGKMSAAHVHDAIGELRHFLAQAEYAYQRMNQHSIREIEIEGIAGRERGESGYRVFLNGLNGAITTEVQPKRKKTTDQSPAGASESKPSRNTRKKK